MGNDGKNRLANATIFMCGPFVGESSDIRISRVTTWAKGRIWLRENLGKLASRKMGVPQRSLSAVTELHASCTKKQETSE